MSDLHVVHVVCTDAFAGVERYVLNSALCLAAEGCTVTVVGGSETALREPLSRAGIAWLPGSTVGHAVRSLRSISRADVINTHMTLADLAGSIVAGGRGIPLVSTRHFSSRRGSSPLSKVIAGWIARRVNAQIAISKFVAANIEGANTVVYTGVESAEQSDAHREPILLVAQRLEAEKFTDVAIRAWARVTDHRGWRLQIAGEGAQLDALIALADELGVRESIDFLGFRADMDALFDRASLYFAPTAREGLGLAVIEAMAHALPVIASRGGGHLESVGGVTHPALFDVGNDAEAAQQIERLIADADERAEYGRALQARQREVFNLSDQTSATLRIFAAVARRKG